MRLWPLLLLTLPAACRLNETPLQTLERKCAKNDLISCYNLGYSFREGQGGAAVDLKRAIALFEKACDGEVLEACEHLGLMHDQGIGMPSDPEKARQAYRFACDRHGAGSCVNLGLMVTEGEYATRPPSVLSTGRMTCTWILPTIFDRESVPKLVDSKL